jgi:hypothetical protein
MGKLCILTACATLVAALAVAHAADLEDTPAAAKHPKKTQAKTSSKEKKTAKSSKSNKPAKTSKKEKVVAKGAVKSKPAPKVKQKAAATVHKPADKSKVAAGHKAAPAKAEPKTATVAHKPDKSHTKEAKKESKPKAAVPSLAQPVPPTAEAPPPPPAPEASHAPALPPPEPEAPPEPEYDFLPWLQPFASEAPVEIPPAPRPSATLQIVFRAADAKDEWKAKAFQNSVMSYVAGFSNLVVLDEESKTVPDFRWTGVYSGEAVYYRLVDAESDATIQTGSLEIADWMNSRLQVQALSVIKPVVKPGGLIDLRNERHDEKKALEVTAESAQILDASIVARFGWLIAAIAGALWGFLFLRIGRFCLSHIKGVQQIGYHGLSRYIRSWTEVALAKILIVLFIFGIPAALVYALVVPRFATSEAAIMIVVPIAGVLVLFALQAWNTFATKALDQVYFRKVKHSPWDEKIRKYLQTQIRRHGADIPDYLLKRTYFHVSSKGEDVVYGGFGLKNRVIIPLEWAELALGAIPLYNRPDLLKETAANLEERRPMAGYEMRSIVSPKGLLGKKMKTRSSEKAYDKFEAKLAKIHSDLTDPDHNPGPADPPPFAAQTGVWGFVLPNRQDESVPLIADNLQDLEVVEGLITEHHLQFAKPRMEEEFDDSDADQKDFLFGLLIRQMGVIARHESILATTGAFFWRLLQSLPDLPARPFVLIHRLYELNFARHPVFVADAFAVLNNAGHQLVQYIHLLNTKRRSMMTSRSGMVKLSHRTADIFERLRAELPSEPQRRSDDTTLDNRLIWLSNLISTPILLPDRARKRWLWAVVIAGLLTAFAMQALIAFRYHPIYQDKIAKMQKQIDDYTTKERERGKGQVL